MRVACVSAKLTPARATSTTTSPSPGSGSGSSTSCITSGPPNSLDCPDGRGATDCVRNCLCVGVSKIALVAAPVALTVVGSIAFDSVKTPFGERERMLGGSAVHFALAASFFTEVRVVGPVGDDFGDEQLAVLAERGIDTADIEHVPGGETFFWRGHYDHDMNVAHTDETQLNVFADFEPKLSPRSCESQMLFLGNIQPDLQRRVRRQSSASFAGARLDEPLDRHRPRLARRRDRRGRLPAAQRRRAADADRGAEPGARGARGDGDRAGA